MGIEERYKYMLQVEDEEVIAKVRPKRNRLNELVMGSLSY